MEIEIHACACAMKYVIRFVYKMNALIDIVVELLKKACVTLLMIYLEWELNISVMRYFTGFISKINVFKYFVLFVVFS